MYVVVHDVVEWSLQRDRGGVVEVAADDREETRYFPC